MFLFIWVNYLNVSLNGTSMVQLMAKVRVDGIGANIKRFAARSSL